MKITRWKRMLCLLLAMLLLGTVLTACSKDPSTDKPQDTPDKPNQNEPSDNDNQPAKPNNDKNDKDDDGGYKTLAEQTGFGYLASYQNLNVEGAKYGGYNMNLLPNGRVVMSVTVEDAETGDYREKYVSLLPDGSDPQIIPMPEFNQNEYVQQACWTSEGAWLVTSEWVDTGKYGEESDTPSVVIGGGVAVVHNSDAPATPEAEPDTANAGDDWTSSTEGDDWTGSGSDGDSDTTTPDTNPDTTPGDGDDSDSPWIDVDPGDKPTEDPVESYRIYRMYKIDLQGNVISKTEINDLAEGEDYFYVTRMFQDSKGRLFIVSEQTIYRLDETLAVDKKVKFDNWLEQVFNLPNDRVIVTYYGENGREMRWLDMETLELGETTTFGDENTYYNIYYGGGNYDLYLDDRNVLYGYSVETGELTPLLNWIDCDVSTYDMNGFCVLSEEDIIFLYSNDDGPLEVGHLRRTPYDQIPARETITIGGTYLNYNIRKQVAKFNRTQEKYRISFVDYSKYETEDNYNAGSERLDMDMVSGKGPDILMTNGSNANIGKYVSKGLLTDLYSFMGEGKTWQKEDLVLGYRKAKEIAGGLYTLSPSFSIQGLWTHADYLGDDGVLSLDELIAACEALPEDGIIMSYSTKSDVMSMLLAVSHSELIDDATGACKFDTPEFAKLLAYANRFPTEIDWETYEYDYSGVAARILGKQQIFDNFYFYSFQDLNYNLAEMRKNLDSLAIVGYPSVDGTTFLMNDDSGLAINSSSKYQDICWEFVSYYLSDEYQNGNNMWQLSVRQDILEKQASDATKRPYYIDENGEKVEYDQHYWNEETGESEVLPPMTQEEVDIFLNVINQLDGTYQYDEELNTVVTDEAAAYFNGMKPAEEVAKLIQNRVQIYVSEQR